MYPLIICPECGKPIAQVYDLYRAMRTDRIRDFLGEEYVDVDPTLLAILDTKGLELGDILDLLNLIECCRIHTITQVEIKEYM